MISLIVATVDRVAELQRLLCSLEQQSARDFEVIVVDQNSDQRLAPVLARHPSLAVQHLHSARGLSRARNVGLRAARGGLIAFPDDDCWYPKDLLASVAAWFESHSGFGLLATCLRTEENKFSGPRTPAVARHCGKSDVSKCVSSATLFLCRAVATEVGDFNENFGVGSPSEYQAGEERDYVLRALAHGFQLWYEPSLTVHHPSLYSEEHQRRTTYSYALSEGCVQRMHHYPLRQVGADLIRSFGGAVVRLCQGDWFRASVCVVRGAGQLVGYIFGPHDLRRRVASLGE
jgi:GT2 family glycosyltransferase